MDQFTASLIYLLVFRLAVLGVGITCIILGYKLLAGGCNDGSSSVSDINAQFGTTKLSFRKVAPGSSFALFGITVISLMISQSSPQVTLRQLHKELPAPSARTTSAGDDTISEIVLKGMDRSFHPPSTGSVLELLYDGDTTAAVSMLRKETAPCAAALNALAWLELHSGTVSDARPLSLAAVNLQPGNADFHHTLALVSLAGHDSASYRFHLAQAAHIDPGKYGNLRLNSFGSASHKGCSP